MSDVEEQVEGEVAADEETAEASLPNEHAPVALEDGWWDLECQASVFFEDGEPRRVRDGASVRPEPEFPEEDRGASAMEIKSDLRDLGWEVKLGDWSSTETDDLEASVEVLDPAKLERCPLSLPSLDLPLSSDSEAAPDAERTVGECPPVRVGRGEADDDDADEGVLTVSAVPSSSGMYFFV